MRRVRTEGTHPALESYCRVHDLEVVEDAFVMLDGAHAGGVDVSLCAEDL